jgi:hypothetical protein
VGFFCCSKGASIDFVNGLIRHGGCAGSLALEFFAEACNMVPQKSIEEGVPVALIYLRQHADGTSGCLQAIQLFHRPLRSPSIVSTIIGWLQSPASITRRPFGCSFRRLARLARRSRSVGQRHIAWPSFSIAPL